MTGATQTLTQQANTAHNLANAATTGFRAQTQAFRAVPVLGDGLPTRTYVQDSTIGANFAQGPLQQTGRDLDVAIEGPGWIAVQRPDGTEAYTRSGSLQVNENGLLQTREGWAVQGEGGPVSIPPGAEISLGKDGTVSVIPPGSQPSQMTPAGRIKLVNPPEADLVKGGDGLFTLRRGGEAQPDAAVRLVGGTLEGSNVNVVHEMVTMIALARQFDMQMRMLQNAEQNSRQAGQLLNLRG
jgi:flagellar basal-body rod protein FlgF